MEAGDREGRAWLEQVEAVSAGLEVNFSLAQSFFAQCCTMIKSVSKMFFCRNLMHGAFTQVVLVVGEVWVDDDAVDHHAPLVPGLL